MVPLVIMSLEAVSLFGYGLKWNFDIIYRFSGRDKPAGLSVSFVYRI